MYKLLPVDTTVEKGSLRAFADLPKGTVFATLDHRYYQVWRDTSGQLVAVRLKWNRWRQTYRVVYRCTHLSTEPDRQHLYPRKRCRALGKVQVEEESAPQQTVVYRVEAALRRLLSMVVRISPVVRY